MPLFQQNTRTPSNPRGQQNRGAGPLTLPPPAAPGAPRHGEELHDEAPNTSFEQALSMALQGMCGASLCAILLLSLLLSSLPLAFLAAWLVSPPSIDRTYPLVFDYRLSNPSATVPLFPPKAPLLWGKQKANTTSSVLLQGQRYQANLILSLPESEHNMNLGMFQVSAATLSSSGEILSSSSLSCMVRFSSLPKRLIRATFLAIPMLLGIANEVQVINLRLLQGNVGPTPLHTIKLFLHPAAGAPGPSGLPQVSSARLRLKTTWWGSSPWLALWPISSFAWLMGLLCFYELLGTCICCNFFLRPGIRSVQSWLLSPGSSDAPPHEMHPQLLPYHALPVATPLRSGIPQASPAGALPPSPAFSSAVQQPAHRPMGDQNRVHPGEVAPGGSGDWTDVGALSEPEDEEVEKIIEVAKSTLRNVPSMSEVDKRGGEGHPAEEGGSTGDEGQAASEASISASAARLSRPDAQQRGLRFRGSRRVDDDEEESENDSEGGSHRRAGSWLLAGPGGAEFEEDEDKQS